MKSLIIHPTLLRQIIRNLGFAILIIGMQIGMYLNLFIANVGWNNIIPPLSLLAILNFRNLSRLKFPLLSNNLIGVIFFQVLILIYIFNQDYSGDVKLFTFFVIATLLSFASINARQFDFNGIVKIGWPIAFICCILGLYVSTTGAIAVETATSDNELTVDGLTIGGGGVICILFSLFYKPKSRILRNLVTLSIIIGAATIVFSGKRSPLIVASAICLFYCFRFKNFSFITSIKTILILVIGGAIMVSVFSTEFNIIEHLNNSIERTVNGIEDMLTGSSKSGASARMRYFAKQWAYNYIDTKFTFTNVILGAGIMTKWLDVPILQSFLDMGIIGILFFSIYVIIYPLKILFSKLSQSPQILFACCYCLPNIMTTFNSGTPYGMARWIPIGLLLMSIIAYRKNNTQTLSHNTYQPESIQLLH